MADLKTSRSMVYECIELDSWREVLTVILYPVYMGNRFELS